MPSPANSGPAADTASTRLKEPYPGPELSESARFGPCHLMEDHRDALFVWRKLGVQAATCVHVDAHLDTCELWLPNLMPGEQSAEINCGNYLLHALREGIVGQLYWVLPPHLHQGPLTLEWVMEELQRWLYVRCSDVVALRWEKGRIIGSIEGHPLTICASHQLPKDLGKVLLDLDIDYFIDGKDQIWQSPFELHQDLSTLEPQCTTVAFSVDGGFTPLSRRFLGYLCGLIWKGEVQNAEDFWNCLQGLRELQDLDPNWLKAARCVALGWGLGQDHQGSAWEQARSFDPHFGVSPHNLANQHWLRHNYAECHRWLDQLEGPVLEYLRGLAFHSEGLYPEAIGCWKSLLDGTSLELDQRAHLHFLCGLAYVRQSQSALACPELLAATRLMPHLPVLWRELGRAQRESGQLEAAAKSWRRALKLAPEHWASLEIRLLLAKVYAQLGQSIWLQQECQQLLKEPATPTHLKLKVEHLLLESRLRSQV
jgi:tetratricopeptide (TPR) repeat protein